MVACINKIRDNVHLMVLVNVTSGLCGQSNIKVGGF